VSRPGTNVVISDVLPPTGAATATDVLFVVGETEFGPSAPTLVRSGDSFGERFGARINPPHVFDAVESFFRDGGARCYVKRLTDGALAASADAGDFTVTSQDVGVWGDGLTFAIVGSTGLRPYTEQARKPKRRLTLTTAPKTREEGAADELTIDIWAGLNDDGAATIGDSVLIWVDDDDGRVQLSDITSIDWGDGSSVVGWSHIYTAAAEGVVIKVEDDEGRTGTSDPFDVVAADVDAPDPTYAAVVMREARVIERSLATLHTVADLADWAVTSEAVMIESTDLDAALQGGAWDLSGGDDGTVPVVDPYALLDAAMSIPDTLGPGQLTAPGKTSAPQHEALLSAAQAGNRVAYLDTDAALDEAGLTAHARALRRLDTARYGGLFDPRAVVPGRATATRRLVAWSGLQSGMTARLDALGNPNRAPAGSFGQSRFAVALEREWSDDERERLMWAGVNTARIVQGTVRGYGFRSLVDPQGPERGWLLLSNVRLAMAIKARGDEIAERYVFENIDGRGRTLDRFRGELSGMCGDYWPDALYGDTFDEACRVVTDDTVNTPESIADGYIRAVIVLRMAPFGEEVEIQVVKQAITEALV
jgi:uncharacterized protein